MYQSMSVPGSRMEWARAGFRRSLAYYPWFCDAKSGDIIISEHDGHRLQLFDSRGNETRFEPFGGYGHGPGQFFNPGGVTTTTSPFAKIIVADTGNRRVSYFKIGSDHQGYGTLSKTHSFGQQSFVSPMGIELDYIRQYLIVTDTGAKRVTMHDLSSGSFVGEFRPSPSSPLLQPTDVAFDSDGRYFVSDSMDNAVHVFDSNGGFLFRFGGSGSAPGQFNKPWGVCFDREQNLIVSDENNNRIQIFTRDGTLAKIIPNVYLPKGVSVNVFDDLVVATGDPNNFLKVIKYK